MDLQCHCLHCIGFYAFDIDHTVESVNEIQNGLVDLTNLRRREFDFLSVAIHHDLENDHDSGSRGLLDVVENTHYDPSLRRGLDRG